MNLLRAAGRAALASYFIVNGAKSVKDPDSLATAAEPVAERVVPLAHRALPTGVAAFAPEDARSLVRLTGIFGILGGLGMATGIAPRKGAALAAASMIPTLLNSAPTGPEDRSAKTGSFVKNLALTGAVLVVSQDTRGRPSMLWSAADTARRLGRESERSRDALLVNARGLQLDAERKGLQLDKAARKQLRLVNKRLDRVGDRDLGKRASKKLDKFVREANHRVTELREQLADAS